MINTEWADGAAMSVVSTTVKDLAAEGGYSLGLDEFDDDDELDYPILVIEGGGGLAYIVTGNLEAFARKVVEAVHG